MKLLTLMISMQKSSMNSGISLQIPNTKRTALSLIHWLESIWSIAIMKLRQHGWRNISLEQSMKCGNTNSIGTILEELIL